MKQDSKNPLHWYADEGKQFQKIADKQAFGTEIVLGESDTIDNYTEVDDPNWEATEAEMCNDALLNYVNRKTGGNYTDLGEVVKDLVNK